MDVEGLRARLAKLTQEERRALEAQLRAGAEIPRRSFTDRPLSFAQQRLWFIDRYEPQSAAYNIPAAFRLYGALDVEALERALRTVIERHEVLRTSIVTRDGAPAQILRPSEAFALSVADFATYPAGERDTAVAIATNAEAQRPFDLEEDLLLRATLFRLREADHVLQLVLHHIAADGWSLGVLMHELAQLYRDFRARGHARLPDLPIQYADYAAWQREHFTGATLEKELDYWRRQLAGAPATLDLPSDRPRPPIRSFRGSVETRLLPPTLLSGLKALNQQESATLFMSLAAGFALLLSRYSGQKDIVVGTAVAGRSRAETENLIGFFANTLALRTDLGDSPSFRVLLRRVRDAALGAYGHQDLPFEALVDALKPQRSLAHTPVFQTTIVLQNAPGAAAEFAGAIVAPYLLQPRSAKFDLGLALIEWPFGIGAELEYDRDLFEPSTARRLLRHYENLLTSAVEEPERDAAELVVLDATERYEIVETWNRTETEFPRDESIAALFEKQAALRPDAIAIVSENDRVTYGELDARADAVAEELRAAGIGTDKPVAVALERGAAMIVAWLGVLKAGGAYVPISPGYPPARRLWMLEDTGATVLIGDGRWRGKDAPGVERVVDINEVQKKLGGLTPTRSRSYRSASDLPLSGGGGALSYIMYTSGSTGTAKGVAVPARAIARLVLGSDYVTLTPDDVVAQVSNASFDAATFEVWGALLNGARLVILPAATVLSPHELAAALMREKVSTMFLTTALFNEVARALPAAFAGLKQLLFGGETADPESVAAVLRSGGPPQRLLHVYGPTETTTFATWHEVTHVDDEAASIPIGRPIANTEIYVLDEKRNPAPIGVTGEIFIGGAGVARGYWRRRKLTEESFVAHPFRAGERVYRSGDLGRLRDDGVLDFAGRADRQIKIRGFRVEPGEVEAALRKHPLIKDAVAVPAKAERGSRRLLAYVVPTDAGKRTLKAASVNEHLAQLLPPYMIPTGIRVLNAFPLTPSGKIDRLLLPPIRGASRGRRRRAPESPLEAQLLLTFEDVLGRKGISTEDNFFDIGGHSLLAVRLMDEVEKTTGRRLKLTTLFGGPTIKELAAAILGEEPVGQTGPLVALQPQGARAPFFFLHGDFMSGGFYARKLAQAMGADQPFHVFHPHGIGEGALPDTIEAMAADYVARLREFKPHGPYFLGGHCNGGLVALEMARVLKAEGEEVPLLVLMDAFAQNEWLRALLGKQRDGRAPSPTGAEASAPRTPRALNDWYAGVVGRYVPQFYPGAVTVFHPRQGRTADPAMGWSAIAASVELREMPGTHIGALTLHVEKTGALLRKCLDAAVERVKKGGVGSGE